MTMLRLRRRRSALRCRELVELVTDYFEGALSRADRRRFEAHVADCPGCAAHLDQLRAVHDRLGSLTPADVPAGTERVLRELFSAWSAG